MSSDKAASPFAALPALSEGLTPLSEDGPESEGADGCMEEGLTDLPTFAPLPKMKKTRKKKGGRPVKRQDTGYNLNVTTAQNALARPAVITDADRAREKNAWDTLVNHDFTALEMESSHPHTTENVSEKVSLQGATVVHVAFALDTQLQAGSSLKIIATHKRAKGGDKKEKKRKKPKIVFETILVNLQSKWNERLENERKLINTNDARQTKKITSKITNQKISVNALEPEGSAKSKLNPKTKTNAQLKVAIKNGIMKNIALMLNSKASEESQPSEKNYEF